MQMCCTGIKANTGSLKSLDIFLGLCPVALWSAQGIKGLSIFTQVSDYHVLLFCYRLLKKNSKVES